MFGKAHDIIKLLKLDYLAGSNFSLSAVTLFASVTCKMSQFWRLNNLFL